MSAFMCSKEHVGYIVAAAVRFDTYNELPRDPVTVGSLMLAENIKSMQYRYTLDAGEAAGYQDDADSFNTADFVAVVPEAVKALKLIHSWRYQTCEHPGHEESEAWQLARRIERLCMGALPGYEQAEWSL